MFSTQSDNYIPIYVNIFDIISLFAAELEEPKIGISGKRLPRASQIEAYTPLGLGLFVNYVKTTPT